MAENIIQKALQAGEDLVTNSTGDSEESDLAGLGAIVRGAVQAGAEPPKPKGLKGDTYISDEMAALLMQLQDWGISVQSKDIKKLLRQAQNEGWSSERIALELRNTPSYQEIFAGKPGYMTEDAWLSQKAGGGTKQSDLAAAKSLLQSWNLPINEKTMGIAKLAREKGWSTEKLKRAFARTKEYKQRFGGKPYDMSESTYIQTEKEYHAKAEVLGINLGEGPDGPGGKKRPEQGWRIKYLFQNDVSPEEFAAKGEAMAFIRDNDEMFKQFKIELERSGAIPKSPKPLSQEHLLAFVFGQGEAQWHETWQNTLADWAAREAGIKIAKGTGLYTGLSRSEIHKIADKNLTREQLQAGFDEVSAEMVGTLPLSQARAYGLTKKDLTEAAFGGPNAAQARAKIERVKKEHEAFSNDRAAAAVGQDSRGKISTQSTLTAGKGYAQSDA